MSPAPFSLNPDLKQLRDEGYVVEQRGGYLVMHQVPYVNASRQVKMGKLISSWGPDPSPRHARDVFRW